MELTVNQWDAQTPLAGDGRTAPAVSAWLAALSVALVVVGMLAVGQGGLLRLLYPALAVLVGLYLYAKHPVAYIAFGWWVWFLSPLIRRLVDYQSGWVDPSPVLLAPVLVGCIAGIGFARHLFFTIRTGGLPFALAFAGTLYGLGVGLIRSGFDYTLAQPMLVWVTPIFLGFHLFLHWRDYPRYRHALQQTFALGALGLGLYGVAQFLWAPGWDRFWMVNVEFLSFGQPEPMGIRVFGTLNAPGPFSVVMMACLLMLFSARGWWKFPAAAGGYLAFLLSVVRAAWIGWAVGLFSLLLTMNFRARIRLLAIIVVVAASVTPLALRPQFRDIIQPRLQTFTQAKDDLSLGARLEGYGNYLRDAVIDPLGKGIGVMDRIYGVAADDDGIGPHDSAVLELLLSLGLPGAICYGAGLVLLLLSLCGRTSSAAAQADSFAHAARAIALGMFVQLLLGSVMLGVMGAVLWGFAGALLAAHRYHAATAANEARVSS